MRSVASRWTTANLETRKSSALRFKQTFSYIQSQADRQALRDEWVWSPQRAVRDYMTRYCNPGRRQI